MATGVRRLSRASDSITVLDTATGNWLIRYVSPSKELIEVDVETESPTEPRESRTRRGANGWNPDPGPIDVSTAPMFCAATAEFSSVIWAMRSTLRAMSVGWVTEWLAAVAARGELQPWVSPEHFATTMANLQYATINNWALGRLSDEEYLPQLIERMLLLLIGGFDTTANMISTGTLMYFRNPEQLAKLLERPELGPQLRTLGDVGLFVLPSTSPANAASFSVFIVVSFVSDLHA